MHLGDIYKRLTDNHFIVIQSFARRINRRDDEFLVVASPLMIVDGFVASDPASCLVGTKEEIEDKYTVYLKGNLYTSPIDYDKALEEDIKPKIENQDKIDMKEIEGVLTEMTDDDRNRFKEDLNKILKGENK